MTMFRTIAAAAAIVATVGAAGSASAYERWVDIHNDGSSTLVSVQISHIDDQYWGPDILSGVVPVGSVGFVDPVNTQGYCRFDIRLSYEDGLVSDIYDVNLCEALDIVTDGYNYDVYTI